MKKSEQLTKWLKGESLHCDEEESLHAPDFSCCFPALLAPKKVRVLYLEALHSLDTNQVDFFERTFGSELQKEIERHEEAKENMGDCSSEMFAEVLEKIRQKSEK